MPTREPSTANPWQGWAYSRPDGDGTKIEPVAWIEPRRRRIPRDIRLGMATFLLLAPFAAATGIVLAASSEPAATPRTPSLPPLATHDLSAQPSVAPLTLVESTTAERPSRTATPTTTRVSVQASPTPEAPSLSLTPSSTPTETSTQSSTAVSELPPSGTAVTSTSN